jgi:hypothetical protein
MTQPWRSLPPQNQFIYLVITLPNVIPISNIAYDQAELLTMSTIRGMFTDPHSACLLATYLMDMSIVTSTPGWKYVDKLGVTFIHNLQHHQAYENYNLEYPPQMDSIGRISIMLLPTNLFSPTTATGACLHDYLPGIDHYAPIKRSTLHFPPITA